MKIKYSDNVEIDFDFDKVEKALLQTCSRETAYRPDEYISGFDGHCKAVSLAIKIFIGGKILKGKVGRKDHYWNLLPNGVEYDPTFSQFPEGTKKSQGKEIELTSYMNPRFAKYMDKLQEVWDVIKISS